ncbi:MAG: RagB/SusD family nutrient uptake outer membrane protein [Tannerellaceae bacterium]|nr:RagB/SusD family nutrient uptake outer membrane protein [Tannerellaceae bacterium]
MKIYQSIVLAILSLLLATSCSDYFDQVPDDRLSLNEIFKTRNGARGYLASVYTYMPDEFNQRQVHETDIFRTQGPWTAASDETEFTIGDYKGKMINNNTINATEDTFVKHRWKSWYTGIHEAAVFLDYIDQTPDDQVTAREKQQWKAEAIAVRAIYYFYLVRAYGPVPVLEENYSLNTPTEELQLPRNTVDECFDFIVSQLKYAQQNGLLDNAVLDDKDTGAGRIDKAIAQVFIIEALTFRASWLFNGECRYYANLANPDGTRLFPQNPTQAEIKENWQKVITECNAFFTNYGSRFQLEYADGDGKAIQSAQDSGFDPYESYRRGVKCRYTDLLTHREAIFYMYENSAGTMQYDRMPNDNRISGDDFKGGSLLGATQEMVDAYFMANGKSPVLRYRADGITPHNQQRIRLCGRWIYYFGLRFTYRKNICSQRYTQHVCKPRAPLLCRYYVQWPEMVRR